MDSGIDQDREFNEVLRFLTESLTDLSFEEIPRKALLFAFRSDLVLQAAIELDVVEDVRNQWFRFMQKEEEALKEARF